MLLVHLVILVAMLIEPIHQVVLLRTHHKPTVAQLVLRLQQVENSHLTQAEVVLSTATATQYSHLRYLCDTILNTNILYSIVLLLR